MAMKDKPSSRTHEESMREGTRVANGDLDEKEAAFKDVDIISKSIRDWNKVTQNKYDLAHEFANMVKHSLSYIKNVKGSGDKILFNEKSLKVRFVHVTVRSPYSVIHVCTKFLGGNRGLWSVQESPP
jgi:uncharacterized protein YhaN